IGERAVVRPAFPGLGGWWTGGKWWSPDLLRRFLPLWRDGISLCSMVVHWWSPDQRAGSSRCGAFAST
ncbi:MAG: hypothetical protein ACLFS4_06895, partial [Opitutales bacterium]